jgi:hypothetical protein
MMKYHGLAAIKAIRWLRIVLPGSIIGQKQLGSCNMMMIMITTIFIKIIIILQIEDGKVRPDYVIGIQQQVVSILLQFYNHYYDYFYDYFFPERHKAAAHVHGGRPLHATLA